jgi:hypothetical protein
MKFFILLFFFCSIHGILFAQNSFEPGYILQQDKDTLRGFIEVTSEADLCNSINFKINNEAAKTYSPLELTGFGIGHDLYRSMHFNNTAEDSIPVDAFLKLLVNGEYNLYAYVKPGRRFYLLQKDTTKIFLYDLVSQRPGELAVKNNYYNYLHFISINCDNLSNQWDRVSFNDQEMARFVAKVDQCLSPQKTTNYYEKPKASMSSVLFAGGFPVPNTSQFTAGFTLRFSLPSIDKKSSINVGINYVYNTQQSSERSDYYNMYTLITHNQIFSVPLTAQYNFTNGRVQPYFYAGASVFHLNKTTNSLNYQIPPSDSYFGLSPVVGIGIEARVAAQLFIKADWRYEVFLQYPVLGIAYRF